MYNFKRILLILISISALCVLALLFFPRKAAEKSLVDAKDSYSVITSHDDWSVQSKDSNISIDIAHGSVVLSQNSEHRNLDGSWSTNAGDHMLCVIDGINDVGDEDGNTSCGELIPGDYIIHELPEHRYITKVGIEHIAYPHLIPLMPSYKVEYWDGSSWVQCAEVIDASEGITTTVQNPFVYTNKIKTAIIEGGANLIEVIEVLDYSADYISPGNITSAATQIDGQEGSDDKILIEWTSFVPTQTVPENTALAYQFRTSDNASDWTDWSSAINYSGEPIDLTGLEANRYLQVKSILSTTNVISTPQIDDYTINFHNNQKPNQPTAQTAIIGN